MSIPGNAASLREGLPRTLSCPAQYLSESRKTYNQAFADQLARGIIYEISLDQVNSSDCIWIPHRPVVKTDPLTTTKVRPMFNCLVIRL